MSKIKICLASVLFLLTLTMYSAIVQAAEAEPSLQLKETETKNVYEVTVENWDTEACGVEVHFTADSQIGEYEYTPRLESENTFNLARTEISGEKTTFYIYLSRQAPISTQGQVVLGTLDLSKSGKPGIVADSGYVKTVGADYAETMRQEAGVTVDSKPDSGDNGNNGDNGNSGDNGNNGDNGNSGDNGNNGNNGNSGDNGNNGNNGNSGDNGNNGDNGNSGDNGNNGNNGNSGDNGNDKKETGDDKKTTANPPATAVSKKNTSSSGQVNKSDSAAANSGTTDSSEPTQKDNDTEQKDDKSSGITESAEQPSEESSQVPVVSPQEQPQEVNKSGKNIILPGVIVVVVVAAAGVVVFLRMKSK